MPSREVSEFISHVPWLFGPGASTHSTLAQLQTGTEQRDRGTVSVLFLQQRGFLLGPRLFKLTLGLRSILEGPVEEGLGIYRATDCQISYKEDQDFLLGKDDSGKDLIPLPKEIKFSFKIRIFKMFKVNIYSNQPHNIFHLINVLSIQWRTMGMFWK